MSSLDFGTYVAAIVAFAASAVAFLKMGLEAFWTRLWGSIKALLGSPSVWFAAVSMLIVGFCVGYIDGISGKRALRSEIAELRSASEGHEKAKTAAEREAASLAAELKRLKENGSPDAKSEAVAGDFKRPVVRAVKPKPAASEANKGQWWPFSN